MVPLCLEIEGIPIYLNRDLNSAWSIRLLRVCYEKESDVTTDMEFERLWKDIEELHNYVHINDKLKIRVH